MLGCGWLSLTIIKLALPCHRQKRWLIRTGWMIISGWKPYLCRRGMFMILAGVMRQCRNRGLVPQMAKCRICWRFWTWSRWPLFAILLRVKGVNRTFVKQGLRVLAQRQNPGLRALMDIARLEQPPTTHAFWDFCWARALMPGGV